MQNATLATLPPEVLDLIFGFVEEEDSSLSAEVNASSRKKVYHALSLMGRTLYYATRPRLYSHPLVGGEPTWTRAQNLLTSLQANGGALGNIVFSLRTLPDWVAALSKSTPATSTSSFQLVGHTRGFAWMVATISACPKLREVGVSFRTLHETSLLAAALKPSFNSLEALILQETPSLETPMDLVHCFLAKLEIVELKELGVRGLGYHRKNNGKDQGTYSKPHTPFRIVLFSVEEPKRTYTYFSDRLGGYLQLLPTHLNSLTTLSLMCDEFDHYTLGDLPKTLGPFVKRLKLRSRQPRNSTSFSHYAMNLSPWGRWRYLAAVLADETFSSFPRLEHLELHNLRTLSVARLEALSRTSPSLVSLICPGSHWLADGAEPSRTIPGWNTTLFPPARLAEVFKSFSQLKKVDLGVVPFKDEADFAQLVYSLEEDKVDVKYELCSAP